MVQGSRVQAAVLDIAALDGIAGTLTSAVISTSMVPDVFGTLTTPKSDATLTYSCGSKQTISIKKPSASGGQAHLTKVARFLHALQIQGVTVPADVSWVLESFTGETNDVPIVQFAAGVRINSPLIKKYGMPAELHQNRLYPSTIRAQFPGRWEVFSKWFEKHLPEITHLCFRTGYCADLLNHADRLFWGKTNCFYDLKRLIAHMDGNHIEPSRRGYYAGSTITLPWGFVQVHRPGKSEGPYQLQFHYSMQQLLELCR